MLVPLPPTASRPPMVVVHDFGAVGQGASNARYVQCENGSEYLLKGAGLSPSHPFVAPNEWIAAELGRSMTLPVLDHDYAEFDGHTCFAAQYMAKGTWFPSITRDLFDKCLNRDRVYGLVVLDVWICNSDRHAGNLLVRSKAGGGGELMVLNDHSHCLVQPGQSPSDLDRLLTTGIGPYILLDFVREAIADPKALDAAVLAAESIDDPAIHRIVGAAPPGWWSDSTDPVRYQTFLQSRRNDLRRLFAAERGTFPNLPPGGATP